MLISSKLRYAIMFMTSLAKEYSESFESAPIAMAYIAEDQAISTGYLEQIIVSLKKNNLLRVKRGPGGGYLLNRLAEEITLLDIANAIDEKIKVTRCSNEGEGCVSEKRCICHDLWCNFGCYCNLYLSQTTLQDVLSLSSNEHQIYADYNSISPISQDVKIYIYKLISKGVYNPSSLHRFGQMSRNIVENARNLVAKIINAKFQKIIFTSSGTEANNLAIKGFNWHAHLISATEHLSVIKSSASPIFLNVDSNGIIDLEQLDNLLSKLSQIHKKILVSVMLANNETGVIQPIRKICDLAHKYGAFVHTDAIQALGKIPVDFSKLGVDLMTISSHKIGGLPGCAALIFNCNSSDLLPILTGGDQEDGYRAGTENVLAIGAFAASLGLVENSLDNFSRISMLRDEMESRIFEVALDSEVFGIASDRIGNTSCIFMPNTANDLQLMAFDFHNIAIGVGSACSSGKIEPSHVLKAMGVLDCKISCSIRISLGGDVSRSDIDKIVEVWTKIYLSNQSPLSDLNSKKQNNLSYNNQLERIQKA